MAGFEDFDSFDSFEDSFDEDEMIALTARPPVSQPERGTVEITESGEYTQLPKPLEVQPPVDTKAQDLLAARGEVSILRSRLEALTKAKEDEIRRLSEEAKAAKIAAEERISTLGAQNTVLEDDKKFLHNQLKLRSHEPKRRKLDEAEKPREVKVEKEVRTIVVRTSVPDERPGLVEHLIRHTVRGLPRSCMEYLARISIDTKFTCKGCVILPREPISGSIQAYLVAKQSLLKLDDLVEEFCEVVSRLIGQLVDAQRLLAVPFLLAVLHATVRFRPNAVKDDVLEQLMDLNFDILERYEHTLKADMDDPEFPSNVPDHIALLQSTTMLFSVELLELLFSCAQLRLEALRARVWAKLQPTLLPKLLSTHSPVNVAFAAVEMVIASQTGDQRQILLVAKLIAEEPAPRIGFQLYGLNRMIGSNKDARRLDSMVPSARRNFEGKLVTPTPLPVANWETGDNGHVSHVALLGLRVLELLTVCNDMYRSARPLIDVPVIKILTANATMEQDFVYAHPRHRLVPTRIMTVAKTVAILHVLWHRFQKGELQIPRDTSHELLVLLTRVAFSQTKEGLWDASMNYMRKMRVQFGIRAPLFNEYAEARARKLAHITAASSMEDICEAELTFANGLEFAYEDNTICLAREILEMLTTGPEADNLYSSMNSEVEDWDMDQDQMDER
ncbi:hypothetical protein BABINDRAFT_161198 [Babjeviella inositovora NRRL Y-12698]|uniref:DNA damage checkpoint protein LCD1 n=1 Tax=Babjeviella inositovora NRRL Y-12698 TaxID=984486 RepID=A0A1E3QTH3_9ASCO|nr:uncharacterized protein BABINDRAFT_161198 [Babjeviella inositovora NRRL Y-12698]ODQ80227.1 hypothetical protein BABINDRAFT_161198 [Babjeviella inositovora NRRL Y-12698]